MLIYGTQALAEQYSTLTARSFLDRWRATSERSSQFGALIDIREMAVLQNANRWLDAAALAACRPPGFAIDRIEAAPGLLATLADRDEIGSALLVLRQAVREAPQRPGLEPVLLVLLDNPHLTARQRVAAELMRAQVLRRQERTAEALAQLRLTLAQPAQRGSVALLRDERWVLDDLLSVRRLAEPLAGVEGIRRLLRRVQGRDLDGKSRAGELGLTRQETHVLHLPCEGAANKTIAKAMVLSEATVKFHLANLYRKLGCGTRREAVAAATALGLMA